jgi:hypothetical protein
VPFGFVPQLVQLRLVRATNILHVAQPVVDEPELHVRERGANAAAAIVAAHDNVPDAKYVDGVLQDREAVEIRVDDDVRHVPVHEQLARRQIHDLVRRHSTISASDPEIFWRLLRGETREKIRILARACGCPTSIVVEEIG